MLDEKKGHLSGSLFFICSLSDSLLFLFREDGNVRTILSALVELNGTVTESIEGMVLAHAYILARVVDGATLTDDDVTCDTMLAAKDFDAKTFAFGFATVTGTTDTFFMSHDK